MFIVDDEELGELLEATVGHDNTGYSASWHLDHMAITNMKTGQRFLFPCRQWFDTRIGDGLIERRLAAALDLGKMGYYTFHVVTSDVRGAGTDADVHVALHGDLGDTPTTILPSRPEHFERGETDTFRLQLPWVGRLRTLTIGHNNKGPGPEWHLQVGLAVICGCNDVLCCLGFESRGSDGVWAGGGEGEYIQQKKGATCWRQLGRKRGPHVTQLPTAQASCDGLIMGRQR